mgnify:CR=1 FL=1
MTTEFAVDAAGISQLKCDVAGRPMNVLTPEFRADLAECIDSTFVSYVGKFVERFEKANKKS